VQNSALPSRAFPKADADGHDAVIGHLQMTHLAANTAVMDRRPVMHTVVRDPIDRLISLYNFVAAYPGHPARADALAMGAERWILSRPGDYQCGFLGIGTVWPDMDAALEAVTVWPLESSLARFEAYFASIGRPVGPLERRNVTRERFADARLIARADLAAILPELEERHARDRELVERVRHHAPVCRDSSTQPAAPA
jgi:hypothetical protein